MPGISSDRPPSQPLVRGLSSINGPIPIKAVIVGDNGTGKTSLAQTYCDGEFPDDQVRDAAPFTVLNSKSTGIQGELCSLSLWDTAADESMDRLRPLSYAQSDVFFLCFSIVQPESYESVRAKWAREIAFHTHQTPIVLFGLMADLRSDETLVARLAERELAPIYAQQGESLARELGAKCYVECSALTRAGLAEAIEGAVAAVLPDVKAAIAEELKKVQEAEKKAREAEEVERRARFADESTEDRERGDIQLTDMNDKKPQVDVDTEDSVAPEKGGGCCLVM